jgi:hypothetical protein
VIASKQHYRAWGKRQAKLVGRGSDCSATYRVRWFGINKISFLGDWRLGGHGCELVGAVMVVGKGKRLPDEVRNC